MKKILLHSFLCVSMVGAPVVGWSDTPDAIDTVDSLWTGGQSELYNNMSYVLAVLDNEALQVNKLLKFVVTLPYGVEAANQIMNDATHNITFLKERYKPLPVAAGVLSLSSLLATIGFISGNMAIGPDTKGLPSNIAKADSRLLTGGLMSFIVTLGGLIYILGTADHGYGDKLLKGSSYKQSEQTMVLASAHSQSKRFVLVAGFDVDDNDKFDQNRVVYKVRYGFKPNDVPYRGDILIDKRQNDQSIRVKAEQQVFNFNPDKQIFEVVSDSVVPVNN